MHAAVGRSIGRLRGQLLLVVVHILQGQHRRGGGSNTCVCVCGVCCVCVCTRACITECQRVSCASCASHVSTCVAPERHTGRNGQGGGLLKSMGCRARSTA